MAPQAPPSLWAHLPSFGRGGGLATSLACTSALVQAALTPAPPPHEGSEGGAAATALALEKGAIKLTPPLHQLFLQGGLIGTACPWGAGLIHGAEAECRQAFISPRTGGREAQREHKASPPPPGCLQHCPAEPL